jgi:fucose 4-O-acetylase-like acetyltransferase
VKSYQVATTLLSKFISKSFNLDYLENERYKWIDYLKGIAILLVVYRHVLIGIERTGLYVPDYLVKANMVFYSFRMPLFFILSGMFISTSLARMDVPKLVFKKFEAILYPYLIWCFLQVSLQILFSGYTNASRSAVDYLYILYHPRELDQFWYLPALFNVTLLYIVVKTKLKPPAWVQLLVGLLLYFLSRSFNQVSMISDCMEFYLFFAIGDIFSTFLFSKRVQQVGSRVSSLAVVVPVFILVQVYYLQYPEEYFLADIRGRIEFIFISLIGCFSMFVLALNIENIRLLSFLRVIGYHSLYIYVMHVFVAALVRVILMKGLHISNALLLLPGGILLSIVVCIVFYNLAVKNGYLWFLFSFKRPVVQKTPDPENKKNN